MVDVGCRELGVYLLKQPFRFAISVVKRNNLYQEIKRHYSSAGLSDSKYQKLKSNKSEFRSFFYVAQYECVIAIQI